MSFLTFASLDRSKPQDRHFPFHLVTEGVWASPPDQCRPRALILKGWADCPLGKAYFLHERQEDFAGQHYWVQVLYAPTREEAERRYWQRNP